MEESSSSIDYGQVPMQILVYWDDNKVSIEEVETPEPFVDVFILLTGKS
jgi:hypothetical protein